ncbi:MAG TPA: hypothetical protein VFG83_13780 [Kofleriaceae bacterium]|nr:hypothetical protein [Kofleriaceae bacterium]
MITFVEEFVALANQEWADAKDRIRWDSASEEVWHLILDQHPELVHTVVLNKTTPPSVLLRLAKDGNWRVRIFVAMTRRTPREAFEILAADKDEGVRAQVAYNKKTPRDILERLAEDEEPRVSELARTRLAKLS